MRRFLFVLFAGLLLGQSIRASWAEALFSQRYRDFGTVPHGQVLTHYFTLTNNTQHTLHIANVRVSCGCVTAAAVNPLVKPGEKTHIVATMNTSRFSGEKQVSIYVSFDRPQFEEVRLAVRANSRHDVTITPQTMHFGQIRRGSNVTKSVTVSFFGGGSWQVTKIAADSNYVLPKFREIKRDGYEIAYEVSASLRSDIPVGKWYSDIWLTTNHPTISKIRVPLTVEVQSALTVTPAVAVLDTVKVGQTVERKVIVRGEKPFRIVSVGGTNGELEVFAQDMKPKKLHVLTLRYHATGPAEPEWVIRVHTDLADEPEVVFQVKGRAVN